MGSALQWLGSLEGRGMVFGLEPTWTALGALGHPERDLVCLHIAGTNGKGSTAAFAASLLAAQGRRVGLYTSPHLLHLGERLVVLEPGDLRRREASQEELEALAARVRDRCDPGLTFFEATTVMALDHFERRQVDVVVLETGLGGRLDSTNVCAPLATAITNVTLEHREILGETVELIAAEKAGIIKERTPVVTASRDPRVLAVIAAGAEAARAPLLRLGHEVRLEAAEEGGLRYQGPGGSLLLPTLGLAGAHQRENAAMALALVGAAGLRESGTVPDQACRRALEEVDWPGRLQTVLARPRLVIDAAHNPAAVAVLAEALEQGPLPGLRARGGRARLCFGVLTDKEVEPMLGRLAPLFDDVTLVRPRGPRGRDPGAYRELVPGALVGGELATTLPSLVSASAPEDLVVVAGSCLLCGETLEILPQLTAQAAPAGAGEG